MKITASGGGGFAGLSEHHAVDTATSATGKALEAALAESGFSAAATAPQTAPPKTGADLTRWTISVDDGGRRQSLSFAEDGSADAARWGKLLALIRAAH
jgi:hypothetical protein